MNPQTIAVTGMSNREFIERYAAPGRAGLFGGTTRVDVVTSTMNFNPMTLLKLLVGVFATLLLPLVAPADTFKPGALWPDNNRVHINAHGGGILYYGDTYYWFGEHKTEGEAGNYANVGVHCYSSKDLYNWKDEGVALAMLDQPDSLLVKGCTLERPKVIHNQSTGKFVMWFHHELKGQGYKAALTGLAVSDTVTGPYKYIKSVNPNAGQWPVDYPSNLRNEAPINAGLGHRPHETKQTVKDGVFLRRDFKRGQMARDMTLFVDDDGTAYHIHSSEENQVMHVSELTKDYLGFSGRYARILVGEAKEGPAMFKKDGLYYLIASDCTGWKPNPAHSYVAKHPFGPWTNLGNPCVGTKKDLATTFGSQSTFVLPVAGRPDAFIFMGDRWTPENAIDGRYIWLPIEFKNGKPLIQWRNEWDLSVFGPGRR